MVRPISGFITGGGVFYETEAEAQLHEAREAIQVGCRSLPRPVNADAFIIVLEALADQCGDYLSAHEKVYQAIQDTSRSDWDQGNDGRGSEDTTTLEQFEVSGHEPLSDVGDRTSAETVRSTGEVNGLRVRGNYARGLRRYKDMAVRATPEVKETRESDE